MASGLKKQLDLNKLQSDRISELMQFKTKILEDQKRSYINFIPRLPATVEAKLPIDRLTKGKKTWGSIDNLLNHPLKISHSVKHDGLKKL